MQNNSRLVLGLVSVLVMALCAPLALAGKASNSFGVTLALTRQCTVTTTTRSVLVARSGLANGLPVHVDARCTRGGSAAVSVAEPAQSTSPIVEFSDDGATLLAGASDVALAAEKALLDRLAAAAEPRDRLTIITVSF